MKPSQKFEQKPNRFYVGPALFLIGFLLLLSSTVVELAVKTPTLRDLLQIGLIVAAALAITATLLKGRT